ncbi:MAG TPA: peptidylprolyl isomerase [Acidimicrobiia bacterium]|nr:peptidylprolyl isomerase [Acidimicrobiia bacterium]
MTPIRSRTRSLFASFSLLLALVVVAAACSDTLEDAATVDDMSISRRDLEDELERMLENEVFVEALRQADFTVSDSADSGAVTDTRLASLWLDTLIDQLVIDAEFDERGLKVDDTHRERARTRMETFFTSVESDDTVDPLVVFDYFDPELQTLFVERNARALALAEDESGGTEPTEPTEAEVRAYYDELIAESRAQCPLDKQVAHILVETEDEANEVLERLAAGEDFTSLVGQFSTDEGSVPQGGQLGCLLQGQFVAPFEEAAMAAPIGEPVGPVQSEFGWHVIRVTPYALPSYEVMRDRVIEQLQQDAADEANTRIDETLSEIIEERLTDAEVTVNPRYGRWVVDEQGPRVEPPGTPDVRDGRETTTTMPGGLLGPEAPAGG